MIIPAIPGSSTDRVGRIVAETLARILELPVRVNNIAGDGGVAGTNAIAAAAGDGTVLGLGVSSAIIGGRLLSRGARFSPIDDFQWLAILATFPTAMVISRRSPYPDIAAWLASAREGPSTLVYASVETGSAGHLAGAYLRVAKGARLVHRVVQSSEDRYALLSDGTIDVLFDGVPNALIEAPRSGHRIVAVTSAARAPALPGMPSFGELYQQSFDVWIGLMMPKGLETPGYARLQSAVGVLLGDAAFIEGVRSAGASFVGLSGRGALAFLDAEILRYAKLIATLNQEGGRN
ncbi:MAG: tripartite tricarboxylate transporter substrate binding protein [Betaproteobacteria bacterium]